MATTVVVPRPLLRACGGTVACGHPLAATIGTGLLAAGGNAVDAAVGAAFALFVLLPEACGVGGDALALVREPDGTTCAWNGSGKSPAALAGAIPRDGAGTSAVPGAVDALFRIHAAGGALAWADVLAPATRLAASGMPATASLVGAVARHRPRLERGGVSWWLTDRHLRAGDVIRQPELAALIGRIAEDGPDAIYRGQTAAWIEAAVARDDGLLRATDLADHSIEPVAPLSTTYRDARLWLQPPVSQGVIAGMVLRELVRSGVVSREDRAHVLVEAVEAAFAHRDRVGDSGVAEALLETPLGVDRSLAGRRGGPGLANHTTAIATADAEGRIVSMVISVFDEFGCATVVPEGGFLLNDRMVGFSTDPASPNAAAPGRRPVHTLSPSIVEHDGRVFALTTPGMDGQVQIIAQVVSAIVDEGQEPNVALHLPRWRSAGGELLVEAGFDDDLVADLTARGHAVRALPAAAAPFGAAVLAGTEPTGTLFAASDPRREAWAAGW